MIVSTIALKVLDLLDNLLRNVVIAPIEGFNSIYEWIALIFSEGFELFKFIFPPASRVILVLVLVVHIGVLVYSFILWIIKKIPMLNIH